MKYKQPILPCKFIFVALLLCAFTPLQAGEILVKVGNETIEFSEPKGFHEVTRISEQQKSIFESFTPPDQRLLGVFFTEDDIGRVLKNEAPMLQRYVILKVLRKREKTGINEIDFGRLKIYAKDNFDATGNSLSARLAEQFSKSSNDLSELNGVIQQINVDQIVPLGYFSETDHSLSSATFGRYTYSNSEAQGSYVLAFSSTFVYLQNKMLNLDIYSQYSNASDIEWLREFTIEMTQEYEK